MAYARNIFLIQDELSGHCVSSSRHGNFSDITNAALFHSEENAEKAIKEIQRKFSNNGRCQFSDSLFYEYWYSTKELLSHQVTIYPDSYKQKDDYYVDSSGAKFLVKELKLRVLLCKVVPQEP